MKKSNSIFVATILVIAFVFCSPVVSLSHSGRTDGNGGHYDRSTGEYHYHHGYPAHQHTDGTCPYDYNDNIDSDIKASDKNNSSYKNSSSIFDYIANFLICLALASAVFFVSLGFVCVPLSYAIDALICKILGKEKEDRRSNIIYQVVLILDAIGCLVIFVLTFISLL